MTTLTSPFAPSKVRRNTNAVLKLREKISVAERALLTKVLDDDRYDHSLQEHLSQFLETQKQTAKKTSIDVIKNTKQRPDTASNVFALTQSEGSGQGNSAESVLDGAAVAVSGGDGAAGPALENSRTSSRSPSEVLSSGADEAAGDGDQAAGGLSPAAKPGSVEAIIQKVLSETPDLLNGPYEALLKTFADHVIRICMDCWEIERTTWAYGNARKEVHRLESEAFFNHRGYMKELTIIKNKLCMLLNKPTCEVEILDEDLIYYEALKALEGEEKEQAKMVIAYKVRQELASGSGPPDQTGELLLKVKEQEKLIQQLKEQIADLQWQLDREREEASKLRNQGPRKSLVQRPPVQQGQPAAAQEEVVQEVVHTRERTESQEVVKVVEAPQVCSKCRSDQGPFVCPKCLPKQQEVVNKEVKQVAGPEKQIEEAPDENDLRAKRMQLKRLKSQLAEAKWNAKVVKGELEDCTAEYKIKDLRSQLESANERCKDIEKKMKEFMHLDDGIPLIDCCVNTTQTGEVKPEIVKETVRVEAPAKREKEIKRPEKEKEPPPPPVEKEQVQVKVMSEPVVQQVVVKEDIRRMPSWKAKSKAGQARKTGAHKNPADTLAEAQRMMKNLTSGLGKIGGVEVDEEVVGELAAAIDEMDELADMMGEKLTDFKKHVKTMQDNEKKMAEMMQEIADLKKRCEDAERAVRELQAKLQEMRDALAAAGLGDLADAIFAKTGLDLVLDRALKAIRVFDRLYLDALDRLSRGFDGPNPVLLRYLANSTNDPELLAQTLEQIRGPRIKMQERFERHFGKKNPADLAKTTGSIGLAMRTGSDHFGFNDDFGFGNHAQNLAATEPAKGGRAATARMAGPATVDMSQFSGSLTRSPPPTRGARGNSPNSSRSPRQRNPSPGSRRLEITADSTVDCVVTGVAAMDGLRRANTHPSLESTSSTGHLSSTERNQKKYGTMVTGSQYPNRGGQSRPVNRHSPFDVEFPQQDSLDSLQFGSGLLCSSYASTMSNAGANPNPTGSPAPVSAAKMKSPSVPSLQRPINSYGQASGMLPSLSQPNFELSNSLVSTQGKSGSAGTTGTHAGNSRKTNALSASNRTADGQKARVASPQPVISLGIVGHVPPGAPAIEGRPTTSASLPLLGDRVASPTAQRSPIIATATKK
eukprot:TRINITY_DN49067_c0_g1_i1.p1 TRINITY_DN49067_c0_g1~~TRINITY_DN49067_c0_g1_i1.p1  ORF type:complete len:1156 (-),score=283.77 TRINITY_DN49067_c0_g1_i1:54-3521(-)